MGTGCPSTLADSPSVTAVYGWIARLVDFLIIKDAFFKNGVGLTISGLEVDRICNVQTTIDFMPKIFNRM